jgi:hypothetical protein
MLSIAAMGRKARFLMIGSPSSGHSGFEARKAWITSRPEPIDIQKLKLTKDNDTNSIEAARFAVIAVANIGDGLAHSLSELPPGSNGFVACSSSKISI